MIIYLLLYDEEYARYDKNTTEKIPKKLSNKDRRQRFPV